MSRLPHPCAGGIVAAALLLPAASAPAAIVTEFDVGLGGSTSTVQIDFSNGNGYLLRFHYDGAVTGFDALLAFEAQLPEFTLVTEDFGFGPFVAGLGVLADYEYGTGDLWPVVENYWHYWLDDGSGWEFALVGASARQLFDGSFDGWVFGSPVPPQPVPGPAVWPMVAIAAIAARRRRSEANFAEKFRDSLSRSRRRRR